MVSDLIMHFDLTGTTYTINENEGSDENVYGLRIMDYNSDTGEVHFIIKMKLLYLELLFNKLI